MIEVRHSGASIADVIASVRGVQSYMVPYATATALTRTAKHAADTALPAEMRAVFGSPVAYTLKSLRVEPATKDNLSARVMVKNTADGGVAPENFLLPQVDGGGRKHKRAEAAMRYAGVLRAGQFAMPGEGLSLDANGNVKGAEVRTILTALKNIRAASSTGTKQRKGGKLKNDLFVGKPRGGSRPDGIWRREGGSGQGKKEGYGRIRPLFIFTSQAPQYGRRLNFDGVVQRVAQDRFKVEFDKALQAMVAKGARA